MVIINEVTIEWYGKGWYDELSTSQMIRWMSNSPNSLLECLKQYNELEIWI